MGVLQTLLCLGKLSTLNVDDAQVVKSLNINWVELQYPFIALQVDTKQNDINKNDNTVVARFRYMISQ